MLIDSKLIKDYFKKLKRKNFMEEDKEFASYDSAFPIGYGQTISQPSLVLYMTLLLELEDSSKVLEIGTGSGYQTAMIAPFCGKLYTIENIEPLYIKAKERLNNLGYSDICFKLGDGTKGIEESKPFDRIMVTAAAKKIPQTLIDQLAPLGRMIIPAGDFIQYLFIVTKDEYGEVTVKKDISVRFVPLVSQSD